MQKKENNIRVRLGLKPGGLMVCVGPAEKKERKKNSTSPFGLCIGSVAQRVLGAHLVCLDYRVEVQKY